MPSRLFGSSLLFFVSRVCVVVRSLLVNAETTKDVIFFLSPHFLWLFFKHMFGRHLEEEEKKRVVKTFPPF